jgi:hypothetical protein
MKYYRIKIERRFSKEDKVLGHANGEFVPDGREYFYRIGKGEIIKDAPIFDYFHLQSYGEKKDWEWRLQDVHGFMGEYPTKCIWYISDDFKMLLETFNIAPKYHFYETRLLYKGEKLKYWIFQFPVEPLKNYDYEKSEYFLDNQRVLGIKTAEEYDSYDYRIWKETKKSIKWEKTVFTDKFDLVVNMNGDILCSEKLKTAITTMKLEGFLFSGLDSEVLVY